MWYHNKWCPRFFYKKPDGGKKSGVTGYFLVEWKPFFSIGLLKFSEGSREAYHSHAFNALTWWIKGGVTEEKLDGSRKDFSPSVVPKYTPRDNRHKVISKGTSFALTLRGPWQDEWQEHIGNDVVTLTHGRRVVSTLKGNT